MSSRVFLRESGYIPLDFNKARLCIATFNSPAFAEDDSSPYTFPDGTAARENPAPLLLLPAGKPKAH